MRRDARRLVITAAWRARSVLQGSGRHQYHTHYNSVSNALIAAFFRIRSMGGTTWPKIGWTSRIQLSSGAGFMAAPRGLPARGKALDIQTSLLERFANVRR